jgi:hypothetical protein
MTTRKTLLSELEGLTAVVAAARGVLAEGRAVDLAGLDGRIAGLCEGIRALPAPEAAGFRPRIIALLDEIDRLALDLDAHRAAVAKALGSLTLGRQAVAAYGKSGAGAQ